MPTYEYQCPEGHAFDKFQKMTDKPRAKCPVCGKMATRKISGGAGLVFKGSGFYITDYGKDGKGPRKTEGDGKSAADSTSSAKPEAGSKSDSKSDKPTPKKDSPTKPAPNRGEGKASGE
jgi:putative FmdB family regulatory protein